MFTITADGQIIIDALTLQPATSAKAFQAHVAALPSTVTPRPTIKWVQRGSTYANPRRSDRPSTMFKTVKKLEVTFPVVEFMLDDQVRTLDKGRLYFIADRPDIMSFELVKAHADYPQMHPTQISVLEHNRFNEWARAIFGAPNETKPIAAYGVENLIFDLKWGRVSIEFQTAGERQNETGWSVLEIRFNNPSPDNAIKALARWEQYSDNGLGSSPSPGRGTAKQEHNRAWWKRLFGN